MNYIDITENKKTHSVKNRVINIINREGIQGPAGKDGITPHINQENSHWMIGDIDTGIDAIGKPGAVPYVDDDGYWCLDGERLIKATGERGADGATPQIDNTTYHWFINGIDTGISAIGIKGEDGLTPRVELNEQDGKYYWWIGDTNTHLQVGLKEEDIPQLLVYSNADCFPKRGETKNLYVDETTNELFRWNGSFFIRIETSYKYIDCGHSRDYELIID